MKYLKRFIPCCLCALVLLAGCSAGGDSMEDPHCRYTRSSYKHVYPRHCDQNQYTAKSKFDMTATPFCNGLSEGEGLCSMVQGNWVRRTVQPDRRICYDKYMGTVIGTRGEQWVRLVIEQDSGEVVTQFPEMNAGCR